MQVIGANHVGKLGGLQMEHVLGASRFRNQIKDANTPAIRRRDAGKLTQNDESRAFNTGQSHVGDNQRPFAGFQLGHEHMAVRYNANTPSLGIEDLLDGTPALGGVVEDKNTDLLDDRCRTSTHKTKYSAMATPSYSPSN